jgi:anthranilate phosphoribosyltransferase
LEALGVKIELTPEELRASLSEQGCGFIFAPAYHPAFKILAPVRKALALQGHASVFNLLGPLLNPARPAHQLVGIYSEDFLPVYAKALSTLGRTFAWAVNGNGMDEISLNEPSNVWEVKGTAVRNFKLDPLPLGLQKCTPAEIKGGDPAENARILLAILDGTDRGPKRDLVIINAAAGFVVAGLSPDLAAGVERARAAIDGGAALAKLRALQPA